MNSGTTPKTQKTCVTRFQIWRRKRHKINEKVKTYIYMVTFWQYIYMKHRREGKAEKWAMLLTELPREQLEEILMKSDAKGLSRLAQTSRIFACRRLISGNEVHVVNMTEDVIKRKMRIEHVGEEMCRPSYSEILYQREVAKEIGSNIKTQEKQISDWVFAADVSQRNRFQGIVHRHELILRGASMCSSIHEAYRAKSTGSILDCAEQIGVLYKIAKYDNSQFDTCS